MDTTQDGTLLYEKASSFEELSNTDSEECLLDHKTSRRKHRSLHLNITLWSAIALLVLNIVWSLSLVLSTSSSKDEGHGPGLIRSPARSAVSYEKVTTNSTVYNTNKFRGKPSHELTETWHSAYTKWAHLVVSEEDLEAIDRKSIPLADGSGYLATLDVFHQLHCLNTIREYMFPDYYISVETEQRRFEHVDHCIDTLRLAAMCHGDIALVTFKWQDDEMMPAADFHVEHECRKWDGILDWAKDRQANMSLVVRPS